MLYGEQGGGCLCSFPSGIILFLYISPLILVGLEHFPPFLIFSILVNISLSFEKITMLWCLSKLSNLFISSFSLCSFTYSSLFLIPAHFGIPLEILQYDELTIECEKKQLALILALSCRVEPARLEGILLSIDSKRTNTMMPETIIFRISIKTRTVRKKTTWMSLLQQKRLLNYCCQDCVTRYV